MAPLRPDPTPGGHPRPVRAPLLLRMRGGRSHERLRVQRQANRFGVRLRAVFGSDIGHRDVTDMGRVVAEAYEQVDRGLLTEEDCRDFSFGNARRAPRRDRPGLLPGNTSGGRGGGISAER